MHGQQNKWPHMLTTASLAVSKQILHSYTESWDFSSSFGASVSAGSGFVDILANVEAGVNEYCVELEEDGVGSEDSGWTDIFLK